MRNIQIYKDKDDLINALAESICEISKEAINTRGEFNFVLSGGSSPQKLYELLASKTYKNKIDWSKTYFFFGDERYVGEEDSRRNSLMIKKALFDPLDIPDSNIFNFNTDAIPEDTAKIYMESIIQHFDGKTVEFDFILLGLGDNAHTASLFPDTSVLKETKAKIISVFVKEVDMYRITMTAALINQARNIAFLVFGKEKAEAVYQVLEGKDGSPEQYPARLINSDALKVQWFLDKEATSRL